MVVVLITDRVRSTREGNVLSLFTPGGGVPISGTPPPSDLAEVGGTPPRTG